MSSSVAQLPPAGAGVTPDPATAKQELPAAPTAHARIMARLMQCKSVEERRDLLLHLESQAQRLRQPGSDLPAKQPIQLEVVPSPEQDEDKHGGAATSSSEHDDPEKPELSGAELITDADDEFAAMEPEEQAKLLARSSYNSGKAAWRAGSMTQAYNLLLDAVRVQPNNVGYLLALCEFMIREYRDVSGARRMLTRVAELESPGNVHPRVAERFAQLKADLQKLQRVLYVQHKQSTRLAAAARARATAAPTTTSTSSNPPAVATPPAMTAEQTRAAVLGTVPLYLSNCLSLRRFLLPVELLGAVLCIWTIFFSGNDRNALLFDHAIFLLLNAGSLVYYVFFLSERWYVHLQLNSIKRHWQQGIRMSTSMSRRELFHMITRSHSIHRNFPILALFNLFGLLFIAVGCLGPAALAIANTTTQQFDSSSIKITVLGLSFVVLLLLNLFHGTCSVLRAYWFLKAFDQTRPGGGRFFAWRGVKQQIVAPGNVQLTVSEYYCYDMAGISFTAPATPSTSAAPTTV